MYARKILCNVHFDVKPNGHLVTVVDYDDEKRNLTIEQFDSLVNKMQEIESYCNVERDEAIQDFVRQSSHIDQIEDSL